MRSDEGDFERDEESRCPRIPDAVVWGSQMDTSRCVAGAIKHPPDDATRQKVWRCFYDHYVPWMRKWLKGRGLQDADIDDILQDVATQVLEKIKDFEHNGRIGAFRRWLKFCVRTCLTKALRDRRKQPKALGSELDRLGSDLENPKSEASVAYGRESREEMVRQVVASVDSLKVHFQPKTFIAVRRVLLDGCKAKVVAAEMDMTEVNVRQARFRAMRKLRELFPSVLE